MVKPPRMLRSETMDGGEETVVRVIEGKLTLLNAQEVKVSKTQPSCNFYTMGMCLCIMT